MDISDEEQKRVDSFLSHLRSTSTDINAVNKKYIIDFFNHSIELGRKSGTQKILLMECLFWAKLIKKDFKTATKEDIRTAVSSLLNDKSYSGFTKRKKIVILRQLYKHLLGDDDIFPEQVSWTKNIKYQLKGKSAKDMITREDVDYLLDKTISERTKAIIAFLWETGIRAGELINIKLEDLSDCGAYFKCDIDGKTGKRSIVFVESAPYIKAWLGVHPELKNLKAPLFCTIQANKAQKLNNRGLAALIERAAKQADFKKPFNPHNFRHSSATERAPKLSQAVLCNYYGWTQASKMPATYLHISNDQANSEVLKLYGIEKQSKALKLSVVECSLCHSLNPSGTVLCMKCGRALSVMKVIDQETTIKQMQEQIQTLNSVMKLPKGTVGKEKLRAALREARAKEWMEKITPEKIKAWGKKWRKKQS